MAVIYADTDEWFQPKSRRRPRRDARSWRLKPFPILAGLIFLAGATLLSESLTHDGGLYTRAVYGNAVANSNMRGAWLIRSGKTLKFEVAGHRYIVVAPARELTAQERHDWFAAAAWSRLPIYSADGPLTIDP